MFNLEEMYDSFVDTLKEDANRYLDKFGLSLDIDKDYDFGRKKWVASYIGGSVFEEDCVTIGVNKPVLLNWIKENCTDGNVGVEMYTQLGVSIWHEVGHALIEYYRDIFSSDEDYEEAYEKYKRILRPAMFIAKYEEENVEEFGEYMMHQYTGKSSSMLADALGTVLKINDEINNKQMQELNLTAV